MVETQLINVCCKIKTTKRGNTYLEFKCPFCKNYTKKGNIRKRGGDVFHSHGISGESHTYRTPHCSMDMLKKIGLNNCFQFRLNY